MELYRFRTIDKLLGLNELDNQEIFFASPKILNDPMEGFKDIFWSGDFIVWKNLFKHYLTCLERLCSIVVVSGENHPISEELIPVNQGCNKFPTEMYKKFFESISDNFFSNEISIKLIKAISSRERKVRREELLLYLTSIHRIALEEIFSQYENYSFIEKRNNTHKFKEEDLRKRTEKNLGDFVNMLNNLDVSESIPNALFKAYIQIQEDYSLATSYRDRHGISSPNKKMVFIDFPKTYITKIEELLYPDWYVACFMKDCKNSSVWGHYGDNHRGVCLIYNIELSDENPHIKLYKRVGYGSSGPIYNFSSCHFYPVSYIDGYTQIDFF